MLSLRTFHIEFDRPNVTFTPGELITGNIIIDLAKEKTFRALKLTVKGATKVHWQERRSTKNSQGRRQFRDDKFQAYEQYFCTTYFLMGNAEGGEVRLPEGCSKYPFNFLLPHNIPCSFENRNGHIRYTTKAVIDRPWKFDHECKTAFTVISQYDLNAHSHQCIGVDDEVHQNFCSFCCVNLGSIKVRCRLPTTGFVPGQSIETIVSLENKSSVDVSRICLNLERCLEYQPKSCINFVATDKEVVKEKQAMGPFGELSDIVLQLQVPPIPPSELEYCGILNQKYNARVTVHVTGMHCSIARTYPILIGTIPLRSAILPASYQDISQSTAPVMSYNDPPSSMSMPMPTSPYYAPPYPGLQAISSTSPGQSGTSNQWTNQWNMPPLTYEECMQRADNIKDHDESNYVHGANKPFAPRYPVFNFSTPPCKNRTLLSINPFASYNDVKNMPLSS